jgi:hypothetical protein
VAAGLSLIYVAQSMAFIATGQLPAIVTITEHPTSVVFALDLTLLIPWLAVGAIWLIKRKPWGYVIAGVLSVKGPLYTLVLGVVWMVSIHAYAAQHRKVFSQVGLVFASMAALILLSDYFIQFSVIPISLISGETEGITLLTQYNAHGIFIVLEELGYLLMSLSFLFIAPVFSSRNRLEAAVQWVFIGGFILAMVSLVIFSIVFGLDRQDRFEVAIISINWLVLIVAGILLSRVFKKQLKEDSK